MSEGKIYEAICAVMDDIGPVAKNSKNQQQGFQYRGIDAVMNALNPAMRKHKVFTTPEILEHNREERHTAKGGLLIYSIIKVKYTFYTTDGSHVEATVIGEGMDSGDKSSNKAMSAAYKYACFQTFSIPTEEMADPDKTDPNPDGGDLIKKDPDLLPNGEGMTESRIKKLNDELERTGVPIGSILEFAKVEKVEDMQEATYLAVMRKLEKTKNKK